VSKMIFDEEALHSFMNSQAFSSYAQKYLRAFINGSIKEERARYAVEMLTILHWQDFPQQKQYLGIDRNFWFGVEMMNKRIDALIAELQNKNQISK
jgi:hypothetical protein